MRIIFCKWSYICFLWLSFSLHSKEPLIKVLPFLWNKVSLEKIMWCKNKIKARWVYRLSYSCPLTWQYHFESISIRFYPFLRNHMLKVLVVSSSVSSRPTNFKHQSQTRTWWHRLTFLTNYKTLRLEILYFLLSFIIYIGSKWKKNSWAEVKLRR